MQDTIAQDLKAAMLGKDVVRTSVLRSVKSAMTYALVEPGVDASAGLSDDRILAILAKEAKKRQESADSYRQAGMSDRAEAELAEKVIIEEYLPARLDEGQLTVLVDEVVSRLDEVSLKRMRQVIAAVKAKAGPAVDGALLARLVKERLTT